MVNWSSPISSEAAHKRAGARRRINRQRKVNAFWLSLQVWSLGRQGLTIKAIAAELGISLATAWRHYVKWFGRRRPLLARAKALRQRIAEAEADFEAQFSPAAQAVDREKLKAMLDKLKVRISNDLKSSSNPSNLVDRV